MSRKFFRKLSTSYIHFICIEMESNIFAAKLDNKEGQGELEFIFGVNLKKIINSDHNSH